MRINKPEKEQVSPTPAESQNPIEAGIACKVFTEKSVIEKGEQVGCKTHFSFTNNDVSVKRRK